MLSLEDAINALDFYNEHLPLSTVTSMEEVESFIKNPEVLQIMEVAIDHVGLSYLLPGFAPKLKALASSCLFLGVLIGRKQLERIESDPDWGEGE